MQFLSCTFVPVLFIHATADEIIDPDDVKCIDDIFFTKNIVFLLTGIHCNVIYITCF